MTVIHLYYHSTIHARGNIIYSNSICLYAMGGKTFSKLLREHDLNFLLHAVKVTFRRFMGRIPSKLADL